MTLQERSRSLTPVRQQRERVRDDSREETNDGMGPKSRSLFSLRSPRTEVRGFHLRARRERVRDDSLVWAYAGRAGRLGSKMGTEKWSCEPRPTSLSTQMRTPCTSTMCLAMERPRP